MLRELKHDDSYFMVFRRGCPLADVNTDFSGGSRPVAVRDLMRTAGEFSSEVKRKDFRLLRLEKLIIACAVDGYSTKETAERIGIDEPELKVQLTSIYRKLQVANQFELILFAVFHQLIDTGDRTLPSPERAHA
jgi:DNA-binding CsgD family transcriptional regulator